MCCTFFFPSTLCISDCCFNIDIKHICILTVFLFLLRSSYFQRGLMCWKVVRQIQKLSPFGKGVKNIYHVYPSSVRVFSLNHHYCKFFRTFMLKYFLWTGSDPRKIKDSTPIIPGCPGRQQHKWWPSPQGMYSVIEIFSQSEAYDGAIQSYTGDWNLALIFCENNIIHSMSWDVTVSLLWDIMFSFGNQNTNLSIFLSGTQPEISDTCVWIKSKWLPV